MTALRRFGVSMEADLLGEFDALIEARGYANRSDALRALIRSHLLEARIRENPAMEVIGTITLLYDHGGGDLPNRLTELQHRSHGSFVSTLHVHVDAHTCLEVLVVRGRLSAVRSISDSLCGTRGVRQGKLLVHAGVGSPPHARRGGRRDRPPLDNGGGHGMLTR
jgi:CopG family nickel-responsive transcriptional regulator